MTKPKQKLFTQARCPSALTLIGLVVSLEAIGNQQLAMAANRLPTNNHTYKFLLKISFELSKLLAYRLLNMCTVGCGGGGFLITCEGSPLTLFKNFKWTLAHTHKFHFLGS